VPLCENCNHSYHLDDEYFRVMIATALEPSAQQWYLWTEKVLGSSFVRGPGLRARLADEYERVQKYAAAKGLRFNNGTPVPELILPLAMGFDAVRINRVAEKIVRCLHFHHFSTVLDAELRADMTPYANSAIAWILDQPTGEVGFNNEFLYRLEGANSTRRIWWLAFYSRHVFSVGPTEVKESL
jgi:hypothetical protein